MSSYYFFNMNILYLRKMKFLIFSIYFNFIFLSSIYYLSMQNHIHTNIKNIYTLIQNSYQENMK